MPRFTTWFSTRTFYHQYPLTFSLSNIIAVVAIAAYGMYIYERYTYMNEKRPPSASNHCPPPNEVSRSLIRSLLPLSPIDTAEKCSLTCSTSSCASW
jgi:hypothetical protein